MNKLTKRILSVFLALAMIVTLVPPVTTQAAKTEKMVLYVGEAIYVTDYNNVKSVSSSKTSIVKVAKDKSNKKHANILAKKAGSATVKVKTSAGTYTYKVTVKKFDVSVKMTDMGGGKILLTVKNNTAQTFDSVTVTYNLYDPSGDPVIKDTTQVGNVVAKKTVYDTVYYSTYQNTVDVSLCTAKATPNNSYGRSLKAKYKNESSNISVKTSVDGDEITCKTKNKSKNTVQGENYILFYDSEDNIVDMTYTSFYLKKGCLDTKSRTIFADDYVKYKVVTVAYSYSYSY